MLDLGLVGFTSPLILWGLISLPAIYWLIRALPPQPKRLPFPALRLLTDLTPNEPPPARMPLWLLIFRLIMAAIVFLALAGPVWKPADPLAGTGPVVMMVDNGWQAASRWGTRLATAEALLDKADREGRPVIWLSTAPPPGGWTEEALRTLPEPEPATAVTARLGGQVPVPMTPDLDRAASLLAQAPKSSAVIWLTDGLDHPGRDRLMDALDAKATRLIYRDSPTAMPLALLPPELRGLGLRITVTRPMRDFDQQVTIRAMGSDGRRLSEATAEFVAGAERAQTTIDLPQQLRNDLGRIDIDGVSSAGAVTLLDASSARPLVGISSVRRDAASLSLRTGAYYLTRALEPFAVVEEGAPLKLLEDGANILVLSDVGRLSPEETTAIDRWLRTRGGVLIRFASERMAEGTDELLPVRLRSGDRSFGGALSWETPRKLDRFDSRSPFFGLEVPEDVTIERQLLAVPSPDLAERTWARLTDGTPLVTAAQRGEGWVVLFHTTANTQWSDLALSGLFVDMLRRLLPLARPDTATPADETSIRTLAAQRLLDGLGRLGPPDARIAPVTLESGDSVRASPATPPGYYGSAGAPVAINLMAKEGPIDADFAFVEARGAATIYGEGAEAERSLVATLLKILLAMALADLFLGLIARGLLHRPDLRPMSRGVAALMTLLLMCTASGQSEAQNAGDNYVAEATSQTRLGWVATGNSAVDARTRAGMRGLEIIVGRRTAVRLGEAMVLDPETDPFELFALVYWPVTPDAQPLSQAAASNLSRYLRSGGIVLFDIGAEDPASGGLGLESPEAQAALQRLLSGIDAPPLAPVDREHVLSKSFYLLDSFPGRIADRPLWAEEASAGDTNRVSAMLVSSADLAAAWAVGTDGRFVLRNLPGGLSQRENAFRVGVNLVMYALTGTYKNDQLHLQAVLDRLGE